MINSITFAQAYSPYGTNLSSAGDSETPYGFTGEITDATGNIYLRARYYNPNDGRFLSRDTWAGDINNPLSLNRWMYVGGNPINRTDPSGKCWYQSVDNLSILHNYLEQPINGPCSWFVELVYNQYGESINSNSQPYNVLGQYIGTSTTSLPIVPISASGGSNEIWQLLKYVKKTIVSSYHQVTIYDTGNILQTVTNATSPISGTVGTQLTQTTECYLFGNCYSTTDDVTAYGNVGLGVPGLINAHALLQQEVSLTTGDFNTCLVLNGSFSAGDVDIVFDPNANGTHSVGVFVSNNATGTGGGGGIRVQPGDGIYALASSQTINSQGGYDGFGDRNFPSYKFERVVDTGTYLRLLQKYRAYQIRIID